jgi:predicted AAA+ superfamily ATPase
MAHQRPRHLSYWIKKLIKSAPALGLIGMRQTGKTTLFESEAKTVYRFDKEANVRLFEKESETLLKEGPFPILLDEAQKFPRIFDEVKGQVDDKRTPGRYLMTGSVRFSLKKEIRETMTGRMTVLELLPLGLAESHKMPLSNTFLNIYEKIKDPDSVLDRIHSKKWATPKISEYFLKSGGLPGICFHREEKVRAELMDNHLDTLLGRDLQQIYKSKFSISKLRELLTDIAISGGQPINKSQIGRKISTTVPTINSHLMAFEALFLIRSHGDGYFIEDQGLTTHLCRFDKTSILFNLRRNIYSELLQQIHYGFRSAAELGTYSSTSGYSIPFVLRFADGRRMAILLDDGDRPSNGSLKAATWFQKKFGESAICVILHSGVSAKTVNAHTITLPYYWIF